MKALHRLCTIKSHFTSVCNYFHEFIVSITHADLCEHSKGSLSLDAVMNLSQPIKPLIQTSVVSGSMFTSEGDNLENQQKYEEMLKMCNYGPVCKYKE